MRRLVRYLAPYKLQVAVSAVAIVLKAGSDVLGPYFVKVAVDNYFAPTHEKHSWLASKLSADPVRGVTEIGLLYLASLGLIFGLEFVQTYMMQWTGQKIMFDLRSQIFRHIQQMHVGFFDRNPVGRLVTRLTSDVDALNDMFTSGVLAIFEDVFVLGFIVAIMVKMSWLLALLTLSVIPLILYATSLFRTLCARELSAAAGCDGEDQLVHAGVCVGHERGAAVQSRAAGVQRFLGGELTRTRRRGRTRSLRTRSTIRWSNC